MDDLEGISSTTVQSVVSPPKFLLMGIALVLSVPMASASPPWLPFWLPTLRVCVLGATLQGKEGLKFMMSYEVVNCISTEIGAGLAIAAGMILL
jgi:hypothetical protein